MGVLERGDCDKNNETGLKEGGGIEMSTTVLPLRDARSLRLNTYIVLGNPRIPKADLKSRLPRLREDSS